MHTLLAHISGRMNLESWQVSNTVRLMEEGATIPFIARYRKERTGGLTDLQISELNKLYQEFLKLEIRKKTVLSSIEGQGKLTEELREELLQAVDLNTVEDLYLPFKPRRKTRADLARSRGLEPLARMIISERVTDLKNAAGPFVSSEKEVTGIDDALQGARDIMAEWISERKQVRQKLRTLFEKEAPIRSAVIKGKEGEGDKYQAYFDWEEPASRAPSHRLLAMFRGEGENILRLKVMPDQEKAIAIVARQVINKDNEAAKQKQMAVADSVKRLLLPSLENEFRSGIRQRAEEEAIGVFASNLQQLLMAAPLGQKNVLAIDPGFRTGCKVVCLDPLGQLLNNDTIYPHPPRRERSNSIKKIKSLVNAYHIEAIAIGNGTAGRETEELISRIRFDRDLVAVMVNESGASVYSASRQAREEFPEYDVTVRGAVSIGRRLMDPLAELVKIDPRSIGVGQYQHDVDQKMLEASLKETVEFCVNRVGVELNTASRELLTYVSGIGNHLASRIVAWRNENGTFSSREELKKVPDLGEKAFQLSAGFLRIRDGIDPLDASAVHPDHYPVVENIARQAGVAVGSLIGNRELLSGLDPAMFTTGEVGLPTIRDILTELEKPGRDPRKQFKAFSFRKDIRKIEDISEGMILPAIVTNITDFGAFVDLGVHESGLIHKSQIAEAYVDKPSDFLRMNQHLMVKVIQVDLNRKRIGLSLIGVEQ